MHNLRVFLLSLPLTFCCMASAQPQFSINKIVGRNSISDLDAQRIHQYAIGWAEALLTTDTHSLFNAHLHLVEPLDPLVAMSSYARSLYGKALKEGFAPILSAENDNQMAAVNAIQVLSLLSTEQACGDLQRYADVSMEQRVSVRLSASAGIGLAFSSGIIPTSRLSSVANVIADFASREPSWYVITRQFDSLAALQHVQNADIRQAADLEQISFQLQSRALVELIDSMVDASGPDERIQSLPFILSSLRLQLIEPSVDPDTKSDTERALLPTLILLVDRSNSLLLTKEDDKAVYLAYGEAINTAGFIIDRILDSGDAEAPELVKLWNADDHQAIKARVEAWVEICDNR